MPDEELAAGVEAVLGSPTRVEPLVAADSLSGARLERWVVGVARYVVKELDPRRDWIMRVTGDTRLRPVQVWDGGVLAALPGCVDHAVVGCVRSGPRAAVVLRDVGPWLVPAGGAVIPLAQHLAFIDHMAALHAAFWGWRDQLGLMPLAGRYRELAPDPHREDVAAGHANPIAAALLDGWARLPEAAPRAAALVERLLDDPAPLVAAFDGQPRTLVHGDWKLGNLGTLEDGRTVLLDWAVPGEAPACVDLAWYLAVNCDRMPQSKEAAIAEYRRRLEAHGVDTSGWWDAQLALALLGGLVQLGWAKTAAGGPELAWWEERALETRRYLA